MLADSKDITLKIRSFICLFEFLEVVLFGPPFHMQQYKQIDIMFCITNSTLMDRKYPIALAYIKIEGVIWVKHMLWAVKVWAKMVWKKPSSFHKNVHNQSMCHDLQPVDSQGHIYKMKNMIVLSMWFSISNAQIHHSNNTRSYVRTSVLQLNVVWEKKILHESECVWISRIILGSVWYTTTQFWNMCGLLTASGTKKKIDYRRKICLIIYMDHHGY